MHVSWQRPEKPAPSDLSRCYLCGAVSSRRRWRGSRGIIRCTRRSISTRQSWIAGTRRRTGFPVKYMRVWSEPSAWEKARTAQVVPPTERSSTYLDGQLKLYTHYPTAPKAPGGGPEYHMTQIKAFAMTSDRETFVQGATAFRDARELANWHRDSFIQDANSRASLVAGSGRS